MKDGIKALLNKGRRLLNSGDLFSFYPNNLLRKHTDAKAAQTLLFHQYRAMRALGVNALPRLEEVGFRQYSQNDEDGILLFVFALIGTTNKKCLEICAADGTECNTANLIINHGWWGTLFDGGKDNVDRGPAFYASHPTLLYFLRPLSRLG